MFPETHIKGATNIAREAFSRLHRNPEAGEDQPETMRYIAEQMSISGIRTSPIGGGVVGILRGHATAPAARPARTIGFYAECDALPIQETDGSGKKPFISQKPGFSHLCGHDHNVANLLGTAALLAENRELFAGDILFIFEPAEELGIGIPRMLKDGLFNDFPVPQSVYSVPHAWNGIPLNRVAISTGPITSAVEDVKVTLRAPEAPLAFKRPLNDMPSIFLKIQEGSSRPNSIAEKIEMRGTPKGPGNPESLNNMIQDIFDRIMATIPEEDRPRLDIRTEGEEQVYTITGKGGHPALRGEKIYALTPLEVADILTQNILGYFGGIEQPTVQCLATAFRQGVRNEVMQIDRTHPNSVAYAHFSVMNRKNATEIGLLGDIRSPDQAVFQEVRQAVQRTAEDITHAFQKVHGDKYGIDTGFEFYTPPMANTPGAVENVRQVALDYGLKLAEQRLILGAETLAELATVKGVEEVARIWIGNGKTSPPLHDPEFIADPRTLGPGIKLMGGIALAELAPSTPGI